MSSVTLSSSPTKADYSDTAERLLLSMILHSPVHERFSALGIEGVIVSFHDQEGRPLFDFMAGSASHGSDRTQEHASALLAAKHLAMARGMESRSTRLPAVGRYAGAIRGFIHIVSCRLIPVSPLSASELVEVEDMSELFTLAYLLAILKDLGEKEIVKDMAVGILSRYHSPIESDFTPFL